jgi:hypothetical protein
LTNLKQLELIEDDLVSERSRILDSAAVLSDETDSTNVSNAERKTTKRHKRRKSGSNQVERWIMWGIWAYFVLLIFEGALRKWILPDLATPLLVIRDPVAIVVLFLAVRRNLLPWNIYVVSIITIGVLAMITAVTMGHGVLVVAAFGARALLIHVPFAFVMGRVLNREDVIRFGIITLSLALPMAGLIFLQFYSPQSAWVNRGVGGDLKGAGFSGAMGYMRPPGTFSFVNGLVSFFGMTGAYVFYFWLNPRRINRLLLWFATAALLVSIPLSISRSLIFQVVLSILFFIIVTAGNLKYFPKVIAASLGISLLIFAASFSSAFQKAATVMSTRFETASNHEGGLQGTLVDRFLLDGLAYAISDASNTNLFGQGIGLGTNVGAKYTTGKFAFLVAEGEWARTVGEMGPILGLSLIGLRVGLAFQFMVISVRKLFRGDALPWMLMSFGFITIIQGSWAQPTSLGFFTITTGLVLASFRRPKQRTKLRNTDELVLDDSADLKV